MISPVGDWQLLAVDNASTDISYEILQSYTCKLPIKVLQENKKGKNYALNSALRFVEGDLVVFLDVVVVVDRNWLVNLSQQATLNPEYDILAGMILPYWTKQTEKWIFEWVDHRLFMS